MPARAVNRTAGLLSGGVFLVYLLMLPPTISFGDAGDFITAAWELGVSHAPGYPLHAMIGHLFTWIPFGTVAWRVSLMEALLGAATVFLVFRVVQRIVRDLYASAAASLLLAFSSTYWAYSLNVDVFVLNAFFTALLIACGLAWRDRVRAGEPVREGGRILPLGPRGWLMLCAFLLGLSLTNHQTMVLMGPAFLYLVAVTDRGVLLDPKVLLACVGVFLVGLLPYAYVPLTVALNHPSHSWDEVDSVDRFLRLILRRDYGSGTLTVAATPVSVSKESPLNQVTFLVGQLGHQFAWVGLVLGFAGIAWIFLDASRHWLLFLPVGVVFSGGVFLAYANLQYNPLALSIIERFLMATDVLWAILAGLGVRLGLEQVPRRFLKPARYAAVAVALVPFFVHFDGSDSRGEGLIRDYVQLALDSAATRPNLVKDGVPVPLPDKVLFLRFGDTLNVVGDYLQIVEGVQTDVVAISTELILEEWYQAQVRRRFPDVRIDPALDQVTGNQLAKVVADNIDHFRIVVPQNIESLDGYAMVPVGMLNWVLPIGQEKLLDAPGYVAANRRLFEESRVPARLRDKVPVYDEGHPHSTWANDIPGNYSHHRTLLAESYFRLGQYDPCIEEAEAALTVRPTPFRAHYDLGNCYEYSGRYDQALKYYLLSQQENPDHPDIYRNLASIYTYRIVDAPKAIANWERYLLMKPDSDIRDQVLAVVQHLKGSAAPSAVPQGSTALPSSQAAPSSPSSTDIATPRAR